MSAQNTDIEPFGSYDGFRAVSRESLPHLMTWESRGKTIKRVRRLMLDSGCGIDLIGLGDLSREERDLIVQNAKISLRTANSKTNTKGVAHMRVEGLDELISKRTCWKALQVCFRSENDVRSWAIASFGNRTATPYFAIQKGSESKSMLSTFPICLRARPRSLQVAPIYHACIPHCLHRLSCMRRSSLSERAIKVRTMKLVSSFSICHVRPVERLNRPPMYRVRS